jgi:hypothetical protein
MVTYGKKKRFALPKFRSSTSKDNKQVATQPGESIGSHLVDSINQGKQNHQTIIQFA